MQELCKSHYPDWGICCGYIESFRQFCQAEISLFSPPSTTYLPHETRKAACISAASDTQPRSFSPLRGQRKHALRPLHNREYAANCPLSVARTHRFRHRKSLTATSASSVTRALYCPGRTGLSASSPGSIKKGERRVCHGFHGSSSSQDAGLSSCFGQRLKCSPRCSPRCSGRPASFPWDHGIQGSMALTFCAGT